MSKKLGMEAKLYYDTTPLANGPATGSWDELTSARDVAANCEAAEADMTTRANAGWRAIKTSLRDATIEFEMMWDEDDAGMEAIRDAYIGGNEIALAVMDADITTAGSEGLAGNFVITAFSRSEPLEEGITLSVTAKPSSNTTWYEVGA